MCLFSLLLKCSALSANTWFKTVILTKGLSHQLVYSCHTNVQTHRAKTTWFSQLTSAVGCTPIGVHTCRKIGLRPKRCSSIAQSSTVVSRYSAFNFSNRQQSFVSTLLVRLGLLISYAQVEVFVIIISLSVNMSIPCADQLDNQKISVNQPLPCDYDLVLHRVLSPGELFLQGLPFITEGSFWPWMLISTIYQSFFTLLVVVTCNFTDGLQTIACDWRND